MTELSLPGLRVVVAGLGVSGVAAARALHENGAQVTVVDAVELPDAELSDADPTDADHTAGRGHRVRAQVEELRAAGIAVRTGDGQHLPAGTELVIVSPGWRPDAPLLVAAATAVPQVPIWSEVELAWRLRVGPSPAPWLVVTGTNGKTTTARMLTAMLRAGGIDAVAAGNIGTPLVSVVTAEAQPDVVVAELSSFQLHHTNSVRPHSAVLLNLAADHLDWHGSAEAYADAKAKVYAGVSGTAVHNADDRRSSELAAAVTGESRAVGFTLATPRPGQVGVVEDVLVDRAFVADPQHAAELATFADVEPWAPHNVANALAAAALARSFGVPPEAVAAGLRAYRPDPHRVATVDVVAGVTFVDDSKATNPHAAAAGIRSFERGSVVWIAGGAAKGADFDDLVVESEAWLRAVVLLGADRARLADALRRHAPEIPVVQVDRADTRTMDEVLEAAAGLARPGDTVLLAPACASTDLFVDYRSRGEAFAAAVSRLPR